jgi:hypothetical protein
MNGSEQPKEAGALALPGAKAFVEHRLGPLSSHPYFALRKSRWLFHLPMAALLPLFIWLVLKGINLDFRAIVGVTQGRGWGVIAFLCLFVFLAAMAATAILSLRASLVLSAEGNNPFREEASPGKIPAQSIAVLCGGAVLTGLLFFVLPKLIPAGVVDPAKANKYAFIAVLLPYGLTLALFDWFTPGRRSSTVWPMLFLTELLIAGLFFTVSARAEWALQFIVLANLAKLPVVGPWLAGLTGTVAQGVFRMAGTGVLFACVWTLGKWTLSGFPEEGNEAKPKEREKEKTPLLRRAWRWIKNCFRFGRSDAEKTTGSGPQAPEWFEAMCESLTTALPKTVIKPPTPLPECKIDNPSPLATDRSRNQFFGGLTPTKDQLKAVNLFRKRNVESLAEDDGRTRTGMDLLLEGENGVGKTTALMACALESLLVRGERVAIFVPDSTTRAKVITILNQALEGAACHFFFNASALTEGSAQAWLEAPQDFPDILVCVPEDWEEVFFGRACNVAGRSEENKPLDNRHLLRAWVQSISTVMVDDVVSSEWTSEQVAHLPFLIDKQRLLLATAGRCLQVLATSAKPPHDAIRNTVISRLFATDAIPKATESFMTLRAWRQFVPARAQVDCLSVEPVLFHLVRRGLRLKKQVVVYLPEGDPKLREDARKEFLRRMESFWFDTPDGAGEGANPLDLSPDRFRIVCHLNEQISGLIDTDEDRILIFEGKLEKDIVFPQLASRFGSARTVVFAVNCVAPDPMHREAMTNTRQPVGYPLFVAREAVPMLAAHLRSATVFLQVGAPIPRDALSVFGIRPAGLVPEGKPLDGREWTRNPVLRFLIDPGDAVANKEGSAAEGIWPMACFAPAESEKREVTVPSENVDCDGAVKFGASYHIDETGRALVFGQSSDQSESMRSARWNGPKGEEIAQVDLAFLDELVIARGDTRFWCRVPEWDTKARLVLTADPSRRLGNEPVIPFWAIRLVPLFGAAASIDGGKGLALGVRGPWQGSPSRVQVVELFLGKTGAKVEMSTAQVPAFSARVSIKGTMTPGRDKRSLFGQAVEFEYSAAVTALLLNVILPEENRAAAISELLARAWDTGAKSEQGEFWPELTLGLQTGLKQFAPRLTNFCRLAAFRLLKPGATGSGAVVFFIEPQGTCGTVKPLLKAILDYSWDIAGEHIVKRALEALQQTAWLGPGFPVEEPLDPAMAEQLVKMLSGSNVVAPQQSPHPAAAPSAQEPGESNATGAGSAAVV